MRRGAGTETLVANLSQDAWEQLTNPLAATVYRHNIVKISSVLREAIPAPDSCFGHCYPMNSSKPHQEISHTGYEVCPKSKCTDFLFKCLLDSPEITSNLLQSTTLGKLHSGSNVFSTDHSSTGSHFP